MLHASRLKRITRSLLLAGIGAVVHSLSGCGGPNPKPTVRNDPEKLNLALIREGTSSVRIDGLAPLKGFANGRDCTFMHCLEVVLEGLGRRIDYDELMGLSGLAFRIQVRTDGWDTTNPDPLSGAALLDPLFEAIGWEYDLRIVHRDDLIGTDAMSRAINESIDRGIPVLAANIIPPEDWGIITGYRNQRQWLCRSYNGGAEATDMPAAAWPTAVVLLTQRGTRPVSGQIHIEAVRRGVTMFDRQTTGGYAVGRKAFESWTEMIRAPRDSRYVHANFWTYIGLIDARAAAVRYLRSRASAFGSKDRYILMAADWYDQEVKMLLQHLRFVPNGKSYSATIPPAETRNQQIEALNRAVLLEEKAVDALKRSL